MDSDGRKGVVILGATGSIGQSALAVLRQHPDRLRLVGIAAHRNGEQLDAIAREFDVPHAVLAQRDGESALRELVSRPEVDIVLVAIVGTGGLYPTLAAIRAGKDIALASKEVLVMAGAFVMPEVKRHGVRFVPTDSEHNAIFQCLEGIPANQVQRVALTASGGPFRTWDKQRIEAARPADALQHPTWDMGQKVTIDSASMANKGLEMIEARWLFDLPPEQISVVVHPQSIVHSMVQTVDGGWLAQMGPPSMTFPIQHALLYPDRAAPPTPPLDFTQPLSLTFEPPDETRFPCLRLAREAMNTAGAAPAVFNAANEVAVAAFLAGEVTFEHIPRSIETALAELGSREPSTLDELVDIDSETRTFATNSLQPR